MAVFVHDTFTGTGGTALAGRTADVGGTWSLHSSYSGGLELSDANRLRKVGTSSAASLYYNSTDPPSAEYDVSVNLRRKDSRNNAMGPAGRIATGANTAYFARYSTASARWELFRIVAGSATSMGTFSQTLTVDQDYLCKLEIRDAAKKVYVDGVERISDSDNTITAAGKVGIREGGNEGGSDTTGQHLDDFVAESDAGGGTNRRRRFLMAAG